MEIHLPSFILGALVMFALPIIDIISVCVIHRLNKEK